MLQNLQDRFAGCIIGQALGDALGFLVEGYPGENCGAFVRNVVRPRRLPTERRGPFGFGQYSDDTQLARELVLSLVAHYPFEPADYASQEFSSKLTDQGTWGFSDLVALGRSLVDVRRRVPLARDSSWSGS
jgi:ADP-ribosylglycohydrolase